MEDTKKNEESAGEIDLLELFRKIWKKRLFILKLAGIGAVAGIVVAFSIPKEYTTVVKMAPEGVRSAQGGGMADLAAMAGIDLGSSNKGADGINLLLYPDIVTSTPFIVEMSRIAVQEKKAPSPISLYKYAGEELSAPWWNSLISAPMRLVGRMFAGAEKNQADTLNPYALTPEQNGILATIQSRIHISVDKKTGIITASSTMQDPLVSATVADSLVRKLEEYMAGYRTEKAKRDMAFTQEQFSEARQKYYDAQQRYARAVDANRSIAKQSAQVELDRLQNEQQLAFSVYNQLAQQLENAKIKVQEQTPCVTIIEPASVPVRKSNMGKPTILALFVFLGVIAGIGTVLVKELFFQEPQAQPE